jgi:hypothetical protein
VATAESLKNRDQLTHCLRRMGFALK